MALTLTSDFKIKEELFYSMFLNRVMTTSEEFNAQTNNALTMQDQFVSGDLPKRSQIDEISGLVTRHDIAAASNTALTAKKLVESQTGGVKVYRTLGPVEVSQVAIRAKNLSENDIYASVAEQFSYQILQEAFTQCLRVISTCIGKSTSKWNSKGVKTTFTPKDILEALKFWKKAKNLWALTVMNNARYVQGLGQLYDDKISGLSGLVFADGAQLFTYGRPVLETENSQLDRVDADDVTAGNQAGDAILFLPQGAANVTTQGAPTIVSQLVTGNKHLALRFQGEYEYILDVKQHEYGGTDKNPTDAQLGTDSNWTDRAKSHVGSVGFEYRIKT